MRNTGNNVVSNRHFCPTDSATAPPRVKCQCKIKFEPKVMFSMLMCSKGTSDQQK